METQLHSLKRLMHFIVLILQNIMEQYTESLKNNSAKTLSLSNQSHKVTEGDSLCTIMGAFHNLEN